MLHGRALIDHAIAAIAPFVAETVICGREWPGYTALADVPGPDMGPLGGIAAALDYARAQGFDHVLTIGCDMPVVPQKLLAKLITDSPAFCSDAPILGCWPATKSNHLLSRLCVPAKAGTQSGLPPSRENKDRRLSVRGWADSISATPADWPDLTNINTPADLLAL